MEAPLSRSREKECNGVQAGSAYTKGPNQTAPGTAAHDVLAIDHQPQIPVPRLLSFIFSKTTLDDERLVLAVNLDMSRRGHRNLALTITAMSVRNRCSEQDVCTYQVAHLMGLEMQLLSRPGTKTNVMRLDPLKR